MKKKLFVILGFFLSFLLGYALKPTHSEELDKMKFTLIASRQASVELNKKYNSIYNKLAIVAMNRNNTGAIFAFEVIKILSPEMMTMSKSLGMDCKKYGEDGKPIMVEDYKTGQMNPVEILPEEIRIAK